VASCSNVRMRWKWRVGLSCLNVLSAIGFYALLCHSIDTGANWGGGRLPLTEFEQVTLRVADAGMFVIAAVHPMSFFYGWLTNTHQPPPMLLPALIFLEWFFYGWLLDIWSYRRRLAKSVASKAHLQKHWHVC
jgi:hypothetical protein